MPSGSSRRGPCRRYRQPWPRGLRQLSRVYSRAFHPRESPLVSERTIASYKVLVGLEIHVQLATATKMFTAVGNGATHFGAEPNSLVDPVILGLPGTLPVINKKAVEYSI